MKELETFEKITLGVICLVFGVVGTLIIAYGVSWLLGL